MADRIPTAPSSWWARWPGSPGGFVCQVMRASGGSLVAILPGDETVYGLGSLQWIEPIEPRPACAGAPCAPEPPPTLYSALKLAADRLELLLPAALPDSDHPTATRYVLEAARAALAAAERSA